MKKLSFIIASVLCIFLIYNTINSNRINYVSISDNYIDLKKKFDYNEYFNNYLISNNRLGTFNTSFVNSSAQLLYNDLINNKTIRINNNDYFFKKVLRESDLVVISVGMLEFSHNYDKYDMIKNKAMFSRLYLDIEELVKEVKKYAFGKIVFLGLYNPSEYYDSHVDSFFYDINTKIKSLMEKNNIIYISLYEFIKCNNKSIEHLKIDNLLDNYLK